MNKDLKTRIAEEARRYMREKGMSQAAFARHSGVGASYLSNILNGIFEYRAADDKSVVIADKYFAAIARTIGLPLETSWWSIVETPQFVQTISALEDARNRSLTKMIIGESGCGKTLSVNQFVKAHPVNTFKVTVSSLHKINDVVEDLAEAAGIRLSTRKASRLKAIAARFRELSLQGGRPVIIFDEAENLKPGTIGLCKAIYDAVSEYAGFVLIGTDELVYKLDRLERYHTEGIIQFRRRFKAGTVHLKRINSRSFEKFMVRVADPELRRLLPGICRNYGELHDYLEPALRAAAEDNTPLDADYFKAMYYISKD